MCATINRKVINPAPGGNFVTCPANHSQSDLKLLHRGFSTMSQNATFHNNAVGLIKQYHSRDNVHANELASKQERERGRERTNNQPSKLNLANKPQVSSSDPKFLWLRHDFE